MIIQDGVVYKSFQSEQLLHQPCWDFYSVWFYSTMQFLVLRSYINFPLTPDYSSIYKHAETYKTQINSSSYRGKELIEKKKEKLPFMYYGSFSILVAFQALLLTVLKFYFSKLIYEISLYNSTLVLSACTFVLTRCCLA